jgi:cytoskeletal protein RodZ
MKHYSLTKLLSIFVLVYAAILPILSACGTQVGNPTDENPPIKSSADSPNDKAKNEVKTEAKADSTEAKADSTETASQEPGPQKLCVVSVSSQPIVSPAASGSLTITLASGAEFSASITAPNLAAIQVKSLSFSSTGLYKFSVVPTQGDSCSAEITIDSDLFLKVVSVSITIP